jgi:hypothetical protein
VNCALKGSATVKPVILKGYLRLYDSAGPYLDMSLGHTTEATFQYDALKLQAKETLDNYAFWGAEAGAEVEILGKELLNYSTPVTQIQWRDPGFPREKILTGDLRIIPFNLPDYTNTIDYLVVKEGAAVGSATGQKDAPTMLLGLPYGDCTVIGKAKKGYQLVGWGQVGAYVLSLASDNYYLPVQEVGISGGGLYDAGSGADWRNITAEVSAKVVHTVGKYVHFSVSQDGVDVGDASVVYVGKPAAAAAGGRGGVQPAMVEDWYRVTVPTKLSLPKPEGHTIVLDAWETDLDGGNRTDLDSHKWDGTY